MQPPAKHCTRRAALALGVGAFTALGGCASVGDVRGGPTQHLLLTSTSTLTSASTAAAPAATSLRVVVVFMDRTQAKSGVSLPAMLGRQPAAEPDMQQDLSLLFTPIRVALLQALTSAQPRLQVHLQSQLPARALEEATHLMLINPRSIRRSASSFMADVDVVVRDERLRKAVWQGQGEWVRGAAASESQRIAAGLLRALRESQAITDAELTASVR
jgi:hypothetical protein